MENFTSTILQGKLLMQNFARIETPEDAGKLVLGVDQLSDKDGKPYNTRRLFIDYEYFEIIEELGDNRVLFKIPEQQWKVWERQIQEHASQCVSNSAKERTLQLMNMSMPKPTFPSEEEISKRKNTLDRDA